MTIIIESSRMGIMNQATPISPGRPRIHPLIRVVQKMDRWIPNFRGKRRLLMRLIPRSGMQTIPIGTLWAEMDMTDTFERLVALGHFERSVIDAVREELRPGECFCDCGGHVGVVSVSVADYLGPDGEVYAFEPSPPTFSRLAANFSALSELRGRLTAVPSALGASEGRLRMHISSQHGWSTLSEAAAAIGVREGASIADEVDVPVTTLDAFFLGSQPRRPPQAIKIDVEGWEEDVLRGAEQLLSKHPPRLIIVERNDRILAAMHRSFANIETLLAGYSYSRAKDTPNDTFFRYTGSQKADSSVL